MNPATVASGAVSVKSVLFWGFFIGIILVLSVSTIQQCLQQKSVAPAISLLKNQILLANKNLAENSKAVIESGGVYDNSKSILINIWNIINKFSNLIFSIIVIILWLKLFYFIYSHSFMSEKGRFFVNFTLALLTYYILEVIFILVDASINKNVNSIADFIAILYIPIGSFGLLIRAIWTILVPISSGINRGLTNNLHSDLNSIGFINETIN